jgi:UDP-glucose 4-epimerase
MKNKSAINIQVIKQKNTGEIFLIEINPRFATTINLSIEAGINMPQMMIENNYSKCDYQDSLVMVRDYKEYFVSNHKKIFITGGAGFIGSNLVHYLCKYTNHVITVYDNLSTVNCGIENIKDLIDSKKIKFIKGDILDEALLSSSIKDSDIVIHLAAQLEITASYKNQIYDLNINLIGTINVINSCIKHNIKRLINASSACVYGFTEGKSSKENDLTNPNWEYGITKLAAEKYIQVASNTHGLKYTSLRFSIVYGKNEWYGRVLPIFVKRALERKDLVIFGDGKQTRDYINVLDCVKFIEECINNKNTHNQVFNVSSGKNISIRELSQKIKNIFKNINIVYEDVKEGEISKLVEGRERLNQELRHLYLDNSKATKSTNWKPTVNFNEGLYEYIEWIKLKHKDYWTYLKC